MNAETALIAAAEAAVTTFALRQRITDRHPKVSEVFAYETGLTVAIEVSASGYDIEIRSDGQQIAAIWQTGWHTAQATYATAALDLLALIVAAITAAGRGSLIVEVAPAA
jgi:hypothetical protein